MVRPRQEASTGTSRRREGVRARALDVELPTRALPDMIDSRASPKRTVEIEYSAGHDPRQEGEALTERRLRRRRAPATGERERPLRS